MARIVIVPGLGVRTYASAAARRLEQAGHEVSLLRARVARGADRSGGVRPGARR